MKAIDTTAPPSTVGSPGHWISPKKPKRSSGKSPTLDPNLLQTVREPIRWLTTLGSAGNPEEIAGAVKRAMAGAVDHNWDPPAWLYEHQRIGAKRIAGRLNAFGCAILADAVGLGKTYTALAMATRYRKVTVVTPAILMSQWSAVKTQLGIEAHLVSHESLSRSATLPQSEIVIVDEAHRFRNPSTKRYEKLCRGLTAAHVLMLTATHIVNGTKDIIALLRLALPDNGLAFLGVPSIHQLQQSNRNLPASALTAIMVSRTSRTIGLDPNSIPTANDQSLGSPLPIPSSKLDKIVDLIDKLTFPSFQADPARELLRMQLWRHLASSKKSTLDCLARHGLYLEKALKCAERGETLPRRCAKDLFCPENGHQIEFDFWNYVGNDPLDTHDILVEIERINDITRILTSTNVDSKLDRLTNFLNRHLKQNPQSKVIVFTSFIATAKYVAQALHWRHVAMVTGKETRIASGKNPRAQTLRWFAPRAHSVRSPRSVQELRVLVATDLISEGLNLQDADTVIHYDLPWTPLVLQQRAGRIARMGSVHKEVAIHWFHPCRQIDRRLTMNDRLDDKLLAQLRGGVAASSKPQETDVINRDLEAWERHAMPATTVTRARLGYSVKQADGAVFSISWVVNCIEVPEVIGFANKENEPISDLKGTVATLKRFLDAPPAANSSLIEWENKLGRIFRQRIVAFSDLRYVTTEEAILIRRIHKLAMASAKQRNLQELEMLDEALNRVSEGMRIGAIRSLRDALFMPDRNRRTKMRAWLKTWPRPASRYITVEVRGAMIGCRTSPTVNAKNQSPIPSPNSSSS